MGLLEGIIKKEDLNTYSFIKNNTEIFTTSQDKYRHIIDRNDKIYTILDYKKIFEDICDYLEGYLDYHKSDDDKYGNKVISSTFRFYDSIFTDKKYRTDFVLYEWPDIKKDFLEGTKALQDMMLKLNNDGQNELHAMTVLTNNQYGRLSKVFKDDYCIWKMLSKLPYYTPTSEDRRKYNDHHTPCIHEKKKRVDE